MNIVKKILGTQINYEIARLIKKYGGNAISFNHNKYQIVNASKKSFQDGIDLGLVGEVDKVMTSDLKKS